MPNHHIFDGASGDRMSDGANPDHDDGFDQLWDEKTVARHLGIAPKTLRAWRTAGSNLPFVKLNGRLVRYRRSDVEAFVSKNIRMSTSDTIGSPSSANKPLK